MPVTTFRPRWQNANDEWSRSKPKTSKRYNEVTTLRPPWQNANDEWSGWKPKTTKRYNGGSLWDYPTLGPVATLPASWWDDYPTVANVPALNYDDYTVAPSYSDTSYSSGTSIFIYLPIGIVILLLKLCCIGACCYKKRQTTGVVVRTTGRVAGTTHTFPLSPSQAAGVGPSSIPGTRAHMTRVDVHVEPPTGDRNELIHNDAMAMQYDAQSYLSNLPDAAAPPAYTLESPPPYSEVSTSPAVSDLPKSSDIEENPTPAVPDSPYYEERYK